VSSVSISVVSTPPCVAPTICALNAIAPPLTSLAFKRRSTVVGPPSSQMTRARPTFSFARMTFSPVLMFWNGPSVSEIAAESRKRSAPSMIGPLTLPLSVIVSQFP
jgi:hypothetical protein